jgi:Transposase DDE domain
LKKELPVTILARAGAALQRLFGPLAQEAADATGVVQRQRKFTPQTLARTVVLGFLRHPDASDEQLAQLATRCGVPVTRQAVEQRYTLRLVAFLRDLLSRATRLAIGADTALAPLLERFPNVTVLDSSSITLPDGQRDEFPGCGGRAGGGQAALKVQTELDLRSGAVTHLEIEPGRSPDGASSRQWVRRGRGSLQITDLGYFDLAVFAAKDAAGEYFLSRLQPGTAVLPDGERAVDLPAWLAQQRGPFLDRQVWVGQGQRLRCRLIAWRVPEEVANRRRQKLQREHRDKYGTAPSAARLALCDWTILITNVPAELLTPEEAVILYRARWQVELLFKRWKSQGRLAELGEGAAVRQLVRVWARLLAVLVQHWLVVTAAGNHPRKSLVKVCEAVRDFVGQLASALDRSGELRRTLEQMAAVVGKTCQRDPRSKPGTFELLNDPGLLDYR